MHHDITELGLQRSFTTALLLTASVPLAEAAVMEGIAVMDPLKLSDQALLQGTMHASLEANSLHAGVDESRDASALLPPGLRPVLQLSADLRSSFVLRILLGLPRAVCARMLHVAGARIDALVFESLRALEHPAIHGVSHA